MSKTDVHARALRNFDRAYEPVQYERQQCLEDRRFYSIAGAQWEGALGEQFANKPKFEVNKIALSVIRIFNDYRSNRFGVKFVSKDGKNADALADACAKMLRANEKESTADEAYDNAFEEAVGGGFGAYRLRNCYVDETDEEDERQTIKIEPIYDADSTVFFDPDAKRQDKADANYAFVLVPMIRDAYESEFGDDVSSWEKSIDCSIFDWVTPDVVWVAEYYEVEKKKKTAYIYKTIDGIEERYTDDDFEEDEGLRGVLAAIGTTLEKSKKVMKRSVHKWILSGGGVLEDCGMIAGDQIPIIPVYGKRWVIDGVERCMGHVRLAKDSQRLKNMQLSKLGELAALSSVEKPIFTPEQMAGHQTMWSDGNIKDYPYMLVNPMIDPVTGSAMPAGPIGYTKPPAVAPAMAALLQITETDIKEILGNQQAGDEIQANVSGKAVELVQNRLDMQSYIYVSNFAKAQKRSGEVWLSMAKDVYVEEGREVRGLDDQGEASSLQLMQPVMGEDGMEYANDLSRAKFDVDVEVGPTSDSKRASTVRALTGMMAITQDPQDLSVLSAMAMMNLDGEGVSEVRDYYRTKLIKMGVVKPNKKEAEELQAEMANQPPDPNAEYLKAAAAEAQAKAIKAQADTGLTVAKTAQTEADTQMVLAKMDTEQQNQVINAVNAVKEAAQPIQQNPANLLP